MDNSDPKKVDFGFEKVAWNDKAERVRSVFASVAGKYDVMNDLMSFGVHRLWKHFALSLTGLRAGQRALDVAGGTGDLALGLLRQVGRSGRVVLSDVNPAMLDIGRDRLLDKGFVGNVECVVADAERLPFEDHSFDCVTIGFGLRNVTDKAAALQSMHRVLKPGGQLLVLEFSTPVAPGLKPLYDAYSFKVIPEIGARVAGDRDSYQYLVESIRRFPDQRTFAAMIADAVEMHHLRIVRELLAVNGGHPDRKVGAQAVGIDAARVVMWKISKQTAAVRRLPPEQLVGECGELVRP